MKGKTISTARIIAALRRHDGLVSLAAKALGCTHVTIYTRAKAEPVVAAALEEARSALLDVAESQLFKHIRKGNLKAITYTTSRLGRHRGYVTRSETRLGGDDTAPPVRTESFPLAALPLELQEQILDALRARMQGLPGPGTAPAALAAAAVPELPAPAHAGNGQGSSAAEQGNPPDQEEGLP